MGYQADIYGFELAKIGDALNNAKHVLQSISDRRGPELQKAFIFISLMAKKIFISYTEKDKPRMRTLKRTLEKSNFFQTVIIGERNASLQPLISKVKDGIIESDYIVPIITENSMGSQWVNQEIGFASALDKIIIPIVQSE